MENNNHFDVIIIGGSYSGLSAAMSLGRALRQVLIIDAGKPCNSQTPHSHNFITHDGQTPQQLSKLAKEQVAKYTTVKFYDGVVTGGSKIKNGFEIITQAGETFTTKKILFATGIKDLMPGIKGFAECWGISVLHCPYCHGYEVKNERTGIIGNGDAAFHYAQLIFNWTKDLTVFTNGKSTLTEEQTAKINSHNIKIIETGIESIEHSNGKIKHIVLNDNSKVAMTAVYSRPDFIQNSELPVQLGCELTEQGLIKTDPFQKTTVAGVFASGDNSTFGRSLALAVAAGSMAGAMLNSEMITEEF